MQHAIGELIYLFTRNNTNDFAQECVISAHGGWDPHYLTFTVPKREDGADVELWFYSEEGESANDFGINNWGQTQLARVTDKYRSGQMVKNYGLTKYQGKHNSMNEGYDRLTATVEGFEQSNLAAMAFLEKYKKSNTVKVLPSIDIATVRNRKASLDGQRTLLGTELLLEDMVKRLLKVHNYDRIHCYFCRNHSTSRALNWMNRQLKVRRV
jgi:hypothetical protein